MFSIPVTRSGITVQFVPWIREALANLTTLLSLLYKDPLAFEGVFE